MSYYFPRDTHLGYLERFMQMPPDYRFRSSGMAAFHYSASQCDCRNCLYSRGRKHRCCPCVCLDERLETGCVTYAELLLHIVAEINNVNFTERVGSLLQREVKELFFNGKQHKNRWHGCLMTGLIPASAEPDFAAVMFLLTSDDEVWALAKRYISLGTVRFGDIPIRGISVEGYTILKAAKELGGTTRQFCISELADAEIVGDKLLNFTEIGERFKRENKGVFVDGRYVFKLASANEMDYPYAGDPPTPELDPAHSIWLRVQNAHTPDVFVELALPADKATLAMTAREIGHDSLRGAAFFCSRCAVPHFRCALNGDEPIDVLNAAAEKLLQIQKGSELPKLKAAMEHTDCAKLTDLLPLMVALDSFTFLPSITNPSDYGEKTLLDDCGLDSAHPAMKHFNFTAYGMECETYIQSRK